MTAKYSASCLQWSDGLQGLLEALIIQHMLLLELLLVESEDLEAIHRPTCVGIARNRRNLNAFQVKARLGAHTAGEHD